MRDFLKRKELWSALLFLALTASVFINMNWFGEHREAQREQKTKINDMMSVVQSADSQLNGAINTIEGGAGALESLYAINIVQSRLDELRGWMQGMGRSETFNMMMTVYAFDRYLSIELSDQWREGGDVAVDASREQALIELRSMKLDLAALASLGQQTREFVYDLDELSEQWKLTMEQRIQEDPDTFVHKELK